MALDRARPPSDQELVRLMLEVPYLIRRPIIRLGDGFNQKEVGAALR